MASFVTKAFQKAVLIHSKFASAGTVRLVAPALFSLFSLPLFSLHLSV